MVLSVQKVFMVFYSGGGFHSSTIVENLALERAAKIAGFVTEQDVYSVRDLDKIAPQNVVASVTNFLDNPSSGVRRGRPQRKIDQDQSVDGSTETLDPPNAA